MTDFTQGISIDGVEYMIPFVSIKREAPFLDKTAERTEDGELHRELIGGVLQLHNVIRYYR